jgi:hypothetical protein
MRTCSPSARKEAVEYIADLFEIVDCKHDTPEFWEMLEESFGDDSWKGFQFMKLDTMTMKMEDASP